MFLAPQGISKPPLWLFPTTITLSVYFAHSSARLGGFFPPNLVFGQIFPKKAENYWDYLLILSHIVTLLLCDTHPPFSADYSLLLTVLWKLRKLNKLHYSTWYLAFFSENTSASGVEWPPASYFMRPPSKDLYEASSFNFNQIARSWCLTIGNWGQKIQILHPF